MKNQKNFDNKNYLGYHTLILGDVNTGKTHFTAKFIQYLVESGFNTQEITILDFAPNYREINGLKIGGQLQDLYTDCNLCNVIELKGDIIPPRLTARNNKELHNIAILNSIKTSEALEKFKKNSTEILIINDISIHLHHGDKKYLLNVINKAETFFGNSYYGKSIKSRDFSLFDYKEKRRVKYLIRNLNRSIKL